MQKIVERTVNAERVEDIITVFGSFDENIRRIEEAFNVAIVNRGTDLKITGDEEAADKAAQQYLENIQNLHEKEKSLFEVKKEEVEASCKTKIKETEKRCKELLEMTKEICDERKKETEEKCQCLEQKAKEEVEKKWNDLSGRLEEFYESHQGLRELLSSGKMI